MLSIHPVVAAFSSFDGIRDPRSESGRRHKLQDVIIIALCGAICGVDNCDELEEFGEAKEIWFRTFLEIPHGIPSQDTFLRVFAALDPREFRECFTHWAESLRHHGDGKILAIDGKTLRKSFDTASGKLATHLVSAWMRDEGLVLGQIKTAEKSNEITAIPELLRLLNIEGSTITIDAMGCQKKIVETIVEKKGDYVIQVKDNQETLKKSIEEYFAYEIGDSLKTSEKTYLKTVEKDHGRLEEREYWHSNDIAWYKESDSWKGLSGFGMVCSTRTNMLSGKTSTEKRYFITSFSQTDVTHFSTAARGHWGIENSLHWVLDVAFDEDNCRIRTGYAAENFAIVRHVAVGLLKGEKSNKKGIRTKRKRCGWDHEYLLQVIGLKKRHV
jgi:predicted transposase YbfD/YdcC